MFDSVPEPVAEGDFAKALIYAANRGASIAQCYSWGWTEDGYYEQAVLDAIVHFTEATTGRTSDAWRSPVFFAAGNCGVDSDITPAVIPKVLAVAAMTMTSRPQLYNYGELMDVIASRGLLDYARPAECCRPSR